MLSEFDPDVEEMLARLQADAKVVPLPPPPPVAPASLPLGERFRYEDPVDLWDMFDPPTLPQKLLPPTIENFAVVKARIQGSSEAAFAMGALSTAANVICKDIRIKVKRFDDWHERCVIWAGLIGPPSAKKTPIISACKRPVVRIEKRMRDAFMKLWAEYQQELQEWEDTLPKKDRGPKPPAPIQKRLLVEDTTTEALQEIQLKSIDRLFCLRDELSGHFASMDRYSDRAGDAPGKAYWLEAFNGGGFMIDRITRGQGRYIECNMVGLLGGIQPEKIREMAQNSTDDGMLQRLIPIIMPSGTLDVDSPDDGVAKTFSDLVEKLHGVGLEHIEGGGALIFSDEAQGRREAFAAWLDDLKHIEAVDGKLASHIGKYSGIFARLCLAFHLIDNVAMIAGPLEPGCIPRQVQLDTANRVADFMGKFMLPHAVAFYRQIIDKSPKQGVLERVASAILANGFTKVSARDFRGNNIGRPELEAAFKQLEAYGWLQAVPGPRADSPTHYLVNEACHEKMQKRAEEARLRQELARKSINLARRGGNAPE